MAANTEALGGFFGRDPVAIAINEKGAPDVQEMEGLLDSLGSGVAIRQVTQIGEALVEAFVGIPLDQRNKYKVSSLGDKHAKSSRSDKNGWKPTSRDLLALPSEIMAIEESDVATRFLLGCCGVQNLRPLKMKFMSESSGAVGIVADRPFNCGGWICCPHTTHVSMGNNYLGKVEEDFHCSNYLLRCCQLTFCGVSFHDVKVPGPDGTLETKYKIPVSLCCCHGHCNFCGGTIFNNDAIFDIYGYQDGLRSDQPVAHIQKTYGGGNDCCAALARMAFQFDNYLIEFPEKASPEDKALLMGALMQIEYTLFEKTGSE